MRCQYSHGEKGDDWFETKVIIEPSSSEALKTKLPNKVLCYVAEQSVTASRLPFLSSQAIVTNLGDSAERRTHWKRIDFNNPTQPPQLTAHLTATLCGLTIHHRLIKLAVVLSQPSWCFFHSLVVFRLASSPQYRHHQRHAVIKSQDYCNIVHARMIALLVHTPIMWVWHQQKSLKFKSSADKW